MRGGDRLAMVPVSLSGGVEPGARTGTMVGGQPVVIWRGTDGHVRAWADRCPHRGMRLSFGFVRQNQLACIYHGWAFASAAPSSLSPPGGQDTGADGAFATCVAVPAHPTMTPAAKARVPAFAVVEAVGMIWVAAGSADPALPPDARPRLRPWPRPRRRAAGETVHPVRSITVAAPATALRAALAAALPPGTEITEFSGSSDGELITFKGPRLRVIAAVQDRGACAASAHIVTTNPDAAVRKALCRWAALVRDHTAAVVLP
jgi:nitrite reductase/ring-hydroxylating ferredoxin subunit